MGIGKGFEDGKAVSRPFRVRWGGKCQECGEKVEEGSQAQYRDGKFCHEVCPEESALGLGNITEDLLAARAGTVEVCRVCFMTVCDCGKDL